MEKTSLRYALCHTMLLLGTHPLNKPGSKVESVDDDNLTLLSGYQGVQVYERVLRN
jgi:hypothetical protein